MALGALVFAPGVPAPGVLAPGVLAPASDELAPPKRTPRVPEGPPRSNSGRLE